MLASLVGLLVLSSVCSSMMLQNNSKYPSEIEGLTTDPNTHRLSDLQPQSTRSGPMQLPPTDLQWPPGPNMTNNNMRMLLPDGTNTPTLPEPDTSICDMLFSAPIPPSIDQIPLFCICSHCKGTTGPKGDRGDRGLPGEPGSPGRRGMTGYKGYRGFTGPQGIKGQKGDFGEKGVPGDVGFTGRKGERGFKGEKGDQGDMGPAGSQGPQGETGTCPATCESIPGPPGMQGTPGPVGPRGLPGVEGPLGPKGLKGDKGDMGTPGVPGSNGIKGDQGDQGVCHCKDGLNGTDGLSGPKGSKGEKGDTGAQGIQGPIGNKGDQGNLGLMGPPGPCSPAIQSAFSASLNQSFPPANWPVYFPNILLNMQGHFNPSMSIYTAPVNGIYVFSFNFATAQKPLKVGLFRNFYPIVRTTEVSNLATASQTVVLHLTAGDMLWIQVRDSATNGMFTDAESSSTFSGYLLYPDSCEMPIGRDFMTPINYPKGGFSWDGPTPKPTDAPN
ncbi:collagen alpha-1(X) chain-like [Oryzias latipes]|uniref:C1q domain-containing protein n=1 Tax=Oryzias latipes TaxID=8090 RepID=A0A3B3HBU5_ORYLA|nr:collagen alpha-1(X) chain-like [Oryzias latipes]XP_020567005.1 collagen alpha-1(X) chain-like [Oryzias latipes]XP_020567006.1 collagen alpha-1(X) chain-like [Oryzias latipes]XP_020567007.1 collagen alpha-1(X) chain-like [Oryzias latipes]XP_020567008.1 collagen alpha-1(X) chain-like [Oryzias latipes]XP_020567009.1 collagen alpha-1(X) chain-like [Oryzias latipes]XP_020567010.1 collagen alpha-1(X) chain-like [Oryzias latipes]